jgi:O-antigen/teichoic acid export membrane protein
VTEKLKGIYFASVLSKIITVANRGILIPCVASRLLPDDYAKYTLLISAIVFLSGVDIGIGGGTLTKIASAYAEGRYGLVKKLSQRAVSGTLLLSIFLLLAGFSLHHLFGWIRAADSMLDAIGQSKPISILLFCGAILIQCTFNISTKILQGISRQALANILGAFVNFALAVATVFFIIFRQTLPTLAIMTIGLCAIAQIAGTLATLAIITRLPDDPSENDPRVSDVRRHAFLAAAMPFGIMAVAAFIERESPKWFFGASGDLVAVGRFGIYSQISVSAIGLVQMLLIPFWPILLNQADRPTEQRNTLRVLTKLSAGVALGMVMLGIGALALGLPVSTRLWGQQYLWSQVEWSAFGLYVISCTPKHVLFPLLVGLHGSGTAALSYSLEGLLILGYFLLHFPSLSMSSFLFALAIINFAVSCPIFITFAVKSLRPKSGDGALGGTYV